MKDGVTLYISHFKSVEDFPDADLGALFRAVFAFAEGGKPTVPARLRIPYNFITTKIKMDSERHDAIVAKRRESGRLGGIAKGKAAKSDEQPKPKKTKEEIEKNIADRKLKFEKSLIPFMEGYGGVYPKEMLRAFADYWTEPNKSKTKMRWEMQPTWTLDLRLATWARRDKMPDKAKTTAQNGKKTPEQALKEFAARMTDTDRTEDAVFQIIQDNE